MKYIFLSFLLVIVFNTYAQDAFEFPELEGQTIPNNNEYVVYQHFSNYDWIISSSSSSSLDTKHLFYVLAFKNNQLYKFKLAIDTKRKRRSRKKKIRVKEEDIKKTEQLIALWDSIGFLTMDIQSYREYSSRANKDGSVTQLNVSHGSSLAFEIYHKQQLRVVSCHSVESYLEHFPENSFLQTFKTAKDAWWEIWNH